MSPRDKPRTRRPAEHRGSRAGFPAHVDAALRPLARAPGIAAPGFPARHPPARSKLGEGGSLLCPIEAEQRRAYPSEARRRRVTPLSDRSGTKEGLPDQSSAKAGHCISNRNIPRLEPHVTRCKQREAEQSNRNKTRLCDIRLLAPLPRAHRAAFDACHRISNREIARLEPHVTACKQTATMASNREKTRLFNDRFSGVGRRA
jgi:hypothetical protein